MTLIDLHDVSVTLQAEIRVRVTLGIRVGAWVMVRVVQKAQIIADRSGYQVVEDLLTFEFFRLR